MELASFTLAAWVKIGVDPFHCESGHKHFDVLVVGVRSGGVWLACI